MSSQQDCSIFRLSPNLLQYKPLPLSMSNTQSAAAILTCIYVAYYL